MVPGGMVSAPRAARKVIMPFQIQEIASASAVWNSVLSKTSADTLENDLLTLAKVVVNYQLVASPVAYVSNAMANGTVRLKVFGKRDETKSRLIVEIDVVKEPIPDQVQASNPLPLDVRLIKT